MKIKRKIEASVLKQSSKTLQTQFAEIDAIIHQARNKAFTEVNVILVDLYWRVGEYIYKKIEASEWGDSVVDKLAAHIQKRHPNLRGFTRASLFRMRQFYGVYRPCKKVAPLVRQLSWTHNLIILGRCKSEEQREFYIRMAVREKWSKRQLERQFNSCLFERIVLNPPKVAPVVRQIHPAADEIFKDSYFVEFLQLPNDHAEKDLHQGLVLKLKDFLIELGRDFCFVGSEYPLQVGDKDFALDLLFFHRGLNCLVAVELKIDEFQPEHLGKLEFYLEALDRNVRKPHEGPAIGVLLCASKNKEIVEFALSRSLSPTLVADYQTKLPDKKMLMKKLHEFYELSLPRVMTKIESKNKY